MAHNIFISFANEDREVAEEVYRYLKEAGYRPWISRDIPLGDVWLDAIVEAISAAPIMVVILSEQSAKSPEVRNEVEIAFTRGKHKVIPFRIDNVEDYGFLSYRLTPMHRLEASMPPRKDDYERLVRRMRELLPRETKPSEPRRDAPPDKLPPADTTPQRPHASSNRPPSPAPVRPEPQAAATAAKPAASSVAAPAFAGKPGDDALPWWATSWRGCLFLIVAALGLLLFMAKQCGGGAERNENSAANVNAVVNTNRQLLNVNQSDGITNVNATPTPTATPSPSPSPSSNSPRTPLTLPRGLSPTTSELLRQVYLKSDMYEYAGLKEVTVKVYDGKVTLGGFVPSEACRDKAMSIAQRRSDVTGVDAEEIKVLPFSMLLSAEQRNCKKK